MKKIHISIAKLYEAVFVEGEKGGINLPKLLGSDPKLGKVCNLAFYPDMACLVIEHQGKYAIVPRESVASMTPKFPKDFALYLLEEVTIPAGAIVEAPQDPGRIECVDPKANGAEKPAKAKSAKIS